MYNDKIDYLKRAIKRTYKRYTGERTDGKATLKDVLKFFNISIDESRTEDYKINKIDYSIPSIEIIDTKDNTLFMSEYTSDADLLNYSGGEVRFVRLFTVNNNRRIDSLFYIGNETPIIEKMTITNGDYDLVFEREMPNAVGIFSNNGTKFVVSYLQNLEYNGNNVKQQLLTKIFTSKHNDEKLPSTFEQEYTYSSNNYIIKKNSQDKYAYMNNGNVIYGINEFEQEDVCCLNGICFENSNVDVSKYLPFSIHSDDPIFSQIMNRSIMIFKGRTADGIHHNFSIFKIRRPEDDGDEQCYNIYLNYEAIKWEQFKDENGVTKNKKVVVASKISKYPKIKNGNITSSEIRNIINDLDTEFKDNIFIQLVINELKTFANKIDIKNGIIIEELDPLSPKLFINKTFDEIYALVSANQDDYFRLIAEQFDNITHSSNMKEKEQMKVLKQ